MPESKRGPPHPLVPRSWPMALPLRVGKTAPSSRLLSVLTPVKSLRWLRPVSHGAAYSQRYPRRTQYDYPRQPGTNWEAYLRPVFSREAFKLNILSGESGPEKEEMLNSKTF